MERTAENKVVKNCGTRSRTGCITCKVRRVKCDEGKPGCQRCKKFGRLCDGYERKSASPQPRARPKKASPRMETNQPSPTTLAPKPLPPSSSIAFNDEQEALYFQIFQCETINILADGRDSPLWHRIIRQACLEESSIFHCAIAIAALDQACKSRALHSSSQFEFHHRHALQQYGKSLKELQKVIARGDSCIRTTLIASLLIFCFQNFHGDIRLALNNARTTIDLMYNWISNQAGVPARIGFSPAPNIVENELVEAFTRLDGHLINWVGVSASSRDFISLALSNPLNTPPIPSIFSSLKEARLSLDNLKARLSLDNILGRITPPSVTCISRNSISEDPSSNEPPFSRELRAWTSAFRPIFDLSQSRLDSDPNDHSEFIPAGILRVHSLALQIVFWSSYHAKKNINMISPAHSYPSPASVPSSSPPPFSDNDSEKHIHNLLLPDYCEIITVCRAIVNHPAFIKSFIFGGGIIPQLFVVVCKCPDLNVRREAIQILKDAGGRREGVWDAKTMARVGEEILRCEALDDNSKNHQDWDRDSLSNGDFDFDPTRGENSMLSGVQACGCGCQNGGDEITLQRSVDWVEIQLACTGMKLKLPMVRQKKIRTYEDVDEYAGRMYGEEVEEMRLLDWVEQFLHPQGGV
ncbi:hypothetical protein SBOR_4351 [Sclerotinia borealis F-4128]|uniref:Zn(2)-C6 fungal-type domain-containing protein n=1 Tax=Sclerotinia borealis (strain F-4128) TaxID=1432307 RepID=W9CKQ6_SCLBF|nr:hypothetical protein SBOR_4351 [Sclerotinia borealis F-4128]